LSHYLQILFSACEMIEVKNGTVATSETFQLIELFKNFTKDSKKRLPTLDQTLKLAENIQCNFLNLMVSISEFSSALTKLGNGVTSGSVSDVMDFFSEFDRLQVNLGENLEILNSSFSEAVLNLRSKLSNYKDQKVNFEKKTSKIVKSVCTGKLQQQKKFKENKKLSKKYLERTLQQENEITKVLINCKSSEENLKTNVMNLTKMERHLYLELLMSLKGILLMQKELFNQNNFDQEIQKLNSILEVTDDQIDFDNGNIVICKSSSNTLNHGSEIMEPLSVEPNNLSNEEHMPNERFSTSTISYDGSDSGIYSEKNFNELNDKLIHQTESPRFSTIRRSPSPYRSRNSLNVSKPVFCKPPVIEAKTEFKKSSEQFMKESNSIKRNTVKATSRKYEDEDDEVSFYMMNTMVGVKNIF